MTRPRQLWIDPRDQDWQRCLSDFDLKEHYEHGKDVKKQFLTTSKAQKILVAGSLIATAVFGIYWFKKKRRNGK